ncbi:MAG: TonB-dependent receptor [Paludibacteraceae bacterium]|nr:TonB-dependent receptor [Paludibacteraceae bacterium]
MYRRSGLLKGRLLLYFLLCLAASTLYADDWRDSIARQFTLDEVEVTARRREDPVIPVQKLDGVRLEGLSTQSVADAARYFSGVQLKDFGGVGGMKTIDVRSMGTHHVGVFYDGIEIGNAQNGTVDLGKFSMDNIEELALYNGQKSEIFQPAKDYGSAGTIYIKTRRPRFESGKKFNLHITMKAGTFGLAIPSLLYEQKITDNIHFSASAEYTYAHGRYHFRYRKLYPNGSVAWDTTAVRRNGDVQSWRAEAGFFGYLPEGKWHVKGYYYESEKGIPGAIVNNVWKNSQRQWDRNGFVQGNFTKRVTKGYDVMVSGKYSYDRMRYLNPDTTLMYIDNTFTQQEVYLSMAHRLAVVGVKGLIYHEDVNWDLSLSADWQWNYLESNLANFVYPSRHTVLAAVATQLYWKYLKMQTSVLGTFIFDKIHQPSRTLPTATKQRPQLTPAVFLSYQPVLSEELFLRAFYKRIFRMPTFNDLYYTDVGNIALKPEFATQYDGGIQYDKTWSNGVVHALRVQADGYFNQVKDKIVAIPKGNGQYRWQMMNYGYVEIRGCDLSASTTLDLTHDVFLTVAGNYTYQKAQDFTDPMEITYGGQIAYIPWHSCSATANLQWRGLSFNYAFIYVGERYHNSANIPANYEQPWYTHDLSISYSMKHWHFAVEINNIFNQQYEVVLNYPMPGINGKAIVRFIL